MSGQVYKRSLGISGEEPLREPNKVSELQSTAFIVTSFIFLSVFCRIKRWFAEQNWIFFRSNSKFVVESVKPNLQNEIPL